MTRRFPIQNPPGAKIDPDGSDTISNLDPALVDASFIQGRMEPTDANYHRLRDSIAAHGQTSPILVRAHPTKPGRYQAAFGHRRLRAAAELGKPIRCIVKPLSDRDLVIAQGRENGARADLSFIELGRFALALLQMGHNRPTIMQALALDKSALSRLIRTVGRLPTDIIDAIGPAPAMGRRRWMALALAFRKHAVQRPVDPLLDDPRFTQASSDQRFDLLYRHLTRRPGLPRRKPPGARRYLNGSGQTIATATQTDKAVTVTIDRAVAPAFGAFLLGRLDALYADHLAGQRATPVLWHSISR